MRFSRKAALVGGVVAAVGLACAGGDGDGGPGPQPTLAVAKATPSGDAQTDTVLRPLANPYRVLVTRDGAPAQGVTVTWSVGAAPPEHAPGSVLPPSSTSDANGIAQANRTLGTFAGIQTAQASVVGANGSPVGFTATALHDVPTVLVKVSGDNGFNLPGSSNVQYTVAVRDAHDNGAAGVTIDWLATGGGGSIAPASNTTGASGTASATRTLSATEGAHTASATAPTVPGSPSATFTTTALAAGATAGVTIGNNFFDPDTVFIAVGGTVTWTWAGTDHNVTFSTAGAPANIGTRSSGSIDRQFLNAGTFNYHCSLHPPGMVGTVRVLN